MSSEKILILFSSVSFIFYAINSLYAKRLIDEFQRWGYGNLRKIIAYLQILASIGLIVGLYFPLLISIVSFLLFVMMIIATYTRIKVKDGFIDTFPAFFYSVLNFIIFLMSLY